MRRAFVALVIFVTLVLPVTPGLAAGWELGEILTKHIRDNYPWSDVRVKNIVVNEALPQRQPQKIIVERGMPGQTVFSLEYENGARLMATATVKVYDTVVSGRMAFRKGYTLKEEDVYERLMDVQRIPAGAIKDVDEVVGKTLTRSITSNMPFTARMLTENSVIKKGQKVTLLVERGGFRIALQGETKENGIIGSYVKAINPVSKKMVTGILVDEHTVRVEL